MALEIELSEKFGGAGVSQTAMGRNVTRKGRKKMRANTDNYF